MIAIVCIFFAGPYVWLFYAFVTAKLGWEDGGGFHRGIKSSGNMMGLSGRDRDAESYRLYG